MLYFGLYFFISSGYVLYMYAYVPHRYQTEVTVCQLFWVESFNVKKKRTTFLNKDKISSSDIIPRKLLLPPANKKGKRKKISFINSLFRVQHYMFRFLETEVTLKCSNYCLKWISYWEIIIMLSRIWLCPLNFMSAHKKNINILWYK